jgi:hypothetical protein
LLLALLSPTGADADSRAGYCFAHPYDCPDVAGVTGWQPELVKHDDPPAAPTPIPQAGFYPPAATEPPTPRPDDEQPTYGYQPQPMPREPEPQYMTPAETLANCAYNHDCAGAFGP